MFDLGVIYVEILREIKFYMLLKGVHGEQPMNFKAIEEIILTMSWRALIFPGYLRS